MDRYNYNTGTWAGPGSGFGFFMITLVLIILVCILVYILYRVTDPDKRRGYWQNLDTGVHTKITQPINTYNVGTKPIAGANPVAQTPYVYTPKKPPRAKFFGRLEGQQVEMTGHYEEKYVEDWDMCKWKRQKEREEALKAGLVDEKPKKAYKIYDWRAKSNPMPLIDDTD